MDMSPKHATGYLLVILACASLTFVSGFRQVSGFENTQSHICDNNTSRPDHTRLITLSNLDFGLVPNRTFSTPSNASASTADDILVDYGLQFLIFSFAAFIKFSTLTFLFLWSFNWFFFGQLSFMIYTILTTTFMSCYIYYSQSSCYGLHCYYHILSDVRRGKGMKRRLKYIVSKKLDIVTFYENKYKRSSVYDFLSFKIRSDSASLVEFDFYCTCTPLDLGRFDSNSDKSNPSPLDSLPDDTKLSDFNLQAGTVDIATDIFNFVYMLCTNELTNTSSLFNRHDHLVPFHKYRKQFRDFRINVLSCTGISVTGWIAYFLAYRYIKRYQTESYATYIRNHGPVKDNTDDNGLIRRHDGCKGTCCNGNTYLGLCNGWITYCNTYCIIDVAIKMSTHGPDFWIRYASIFTEILGRDNEFTDFFNKCVFRRSEPEPNTQPPRPADEEPADFEAQSGFDPMEILRVLLKEETIKTLKSSIKVIVMLSGFLTLTQSGFSGEDVINAFKNFDFNKIFSSSTFTANAISTIDFLNKLIDAYQTGNLRIFFGIDKVGESLLVRTRWFNTVDVASLSGGVVSHDGKPTPGGKEAFYVHEFQGYGAQLLNEVTQYLLLQESKIGNAATVKTWRFIQADTRRQLTSVLRMLEALGTRKVPFTFMVVGKSSVGKTSVTNIVQRVLCDAFNLPSHPSYTYYLNDTLKHWDGFHVMAHTLVWDDASCVKLVKGEPGFLGQFLNVVGNQPYTSPQAHLDNKANCKVSPRVMAVTSNSLTLQSNEVMLASEAVMRRFHLIIETVLRKEHSVDGMLGNYCNDPKSTKDIDYWVFNVYKVGLDGPVVRQDLFSAKGETNSRSLNYNGFTLDPIAVECSMVDLLKLVHSSALAQDENQNVVMDATSRIMHSKYDPTSGTLQFQHDDETDETFVNQSGSESYASLLRRFARNTLTMILANPIFSFPLVVAILRHTFLPTVLICELLLSCIPPYIVIAIAFGAVFQFTRLNADLDYIRFFIASSFNFACPDIIDARYVEEYIEEWNTQAERAWWHPLRLYGIVRNISRPKPVQVIVALTVLIATLRYATTISSVCETTFQGVGSSDDSPQAKWTLWSAATNLSQTSRSVADPVSVVRLISKNVLKMRLPNNKWTNCTLLCSFGGYNLAVTTLHSVRNHINEDFIDNGATLEATLVCDGADYPTLKSVGLSSDINIEISALDSVSYEDKDLFFFLYQGYKCKDITDYFCKSGHAANSNTAAYLPARSVDNELIIRTSKYCHTKTGPVTVKDAPFLDAPDAFRFSCQFDTPTVPGNCGAPYIQTNGKQTAVVGLHQMGATNNQFSLATRVTQSDIQSAIKALRRAEGESFVMQHSGISYDLSSIFNDIDDRAAKIEPTDSDFPPLHRRSVFRQIDNPDDDIVGTIRVLGSMPESSKPLTSKVYSHPLRDELLGGTGFPHGNKIPPPRLSGEDLYIAKRHFISGVCGIKRNLPFKTVRLILSGYICDAFARLYHPDLSEVTPLSVDESINGKIADGYLNKYMGNLVMATSAGFPYNKPKRDLLQDPLSERKKFIKPVTDQIDRLKECFSSNLEPEAKDVMFSTFLKDEPISEAKAKACKRRVVISGPVAFVIVFRQYFLPIIAFIAANRLAFEACPSTVVQSAEWGLHREYISEGGARSRYFDGDYKGWDASLQKAFVNCFFVVAITIARVSGNYSEEDITCMVGLASVVMNSKINFFGDIIEMCAFMPTGQPATAQTNCVGGSVMIRLAWVLSGHPISEFRHNVRLLTYGDDNWGSISDTTTGFDKGIIANQLKPFGITYTNADKTECSSGFSVLEEVEFLKRTWKFDEELGFYMAPLSLETMGNMCSHLRRSPHASEHDIIASGFVSIISESFYHGRGVYERTQEVVRSLALSKNFNLPDVVCATFEDKCATFIADSQYFIENQQDILSQMSK